MQEGRLKVKKSQCYRYKKLREKFPVTGNQQLYDVYSIEEVEKASH